MKVRNPELYARRLSSANKSRREKVRKRRGLSLDHPSLLSPNHGKGWKMKEGYKQLLNKSHPNASKSGYVMEHVAIMAEKIGRPLVKGETIHHKNGIRDDNRLENLELWVDTCRQGQRVEDKLIWAKEFLERFGYKVIHAGQQEGANNQEAEAGAGAF